MLSLQELVHGFLGAIQVLLLLFKALELVLLLVEESGLLLGDVGQSLAFQEKLFEVGAAVVVVATNLGSFGCVQANLLEGRPVKSRRVVHLIQCLHELLVVLITR